MLTAPVISSSLHCITKLNQPPDLICINTPVMYLREFIFGGSKVLQMVTAAMKFQRSLLLRRKAMTNLDSILKIRDITCPTKVCLVKAMAFPVVVYGCESWTYEDS